MGKCRIYKDQAATPLKGSKAAPFKCLRRSKVPGLRRSNAFGVQQFQSFAVQLPAAFQSSKVPGSRLCPDSQYDPLFSHSIAQSLPRSLAKSLPRSLPHAPCSRFQGCAVPMPSAFQSFRFQGSKVPVEFDVKDSKTRNKK